MSEINGDKARFHRERKKKIAKRQRTRELLNMAKRSKVTTPAFGSEQREVKV